MTVRVLVLGREAEVEAGRWTAVDERLRQILQDAELALDRALPLPYAAEHDRARAGRMVELLGGRVLPGASTARPEATRGKVQ